VLGNSGFSRLLICMRPRISIRFVRGFVNRGLGVEVFDEIKRSSGDEIDHHQITFNLRRQTINSPARLRSSFSSWLSS
jgi:hypothetical protein